MSENKGNNRTAIYLIKASMFLIAGILVLIEALLYFLYLNPSIKSKQERDVIYYSKKLKENPENPDNYLRLAMTYLKAGDIQKAKNYLNQGKKLFPRDYRFSLQLAFIYYTEKNYDKAGKLAKEALKINPNLSDAYYLMGKLASEQGNDTQAADMFAKALANDPYNADLYLELGSIYEKKKLYKQARQLYEKGLEFNPQDKRIIKALERIAANADR